MNLHLNYIDNYWVSFKICLIVIFRLLINYLSVHDQDMTSWIFVLYPQCLTDGNNNNLLKNWGYFDMLAAQVPDGVLDEVLDKVLD